MIKKYLKPDAYLKTFLSIDLHRLKNMGIKVIILDIDNTLVPASNHKISDESRDFVLKIKQLQMIPVIISNNIEGRVKMFAEEYLCDYISFGLKPLNDSYKKILKKYKVKSSEVCAIGDQILTDIVGGNLVNIKTILIEPISNKDNIFGAIIRLSENLFYHILDIERGEYYDHL